MFGTKSALRRAGLAGVGLVAASTGLMAVATPAQAYTSSVVDHYDDSPWFDFTKNYSSPLNSTLTAWLSRGGARYRISMRAGSGDGTTNPCTSNRGWLPDGTYSNNDSDSNSYFKGYNKTDGNTVVRGYVWSLGNKRCTSSSSSTLRTELFIHSQGTSGWSNSNYASEGCVKINQTDRSYLADMFKNSYRPGDGFLTVH